MFYRTVATVTGYIYKDIYKDMSIYFDCLVMLYNTVTTVTIIAHDINDFFLTFESH